MLFNVGKIKNNLSLNTSQLNVVYLSGPPRVVDRARKAVKEPSRSLAAVELDLARRPNIKPGETNPPIAHLE
jgi:hypothetical protein